MTQIRIPRRFRLPAVALLVAALPVGYFAVANSAKSLPLEQAFASARTGQSPSAYEAFVSSMAIASQTGVYPREVVYGSGFDPQMFSAAAAAKEPYYFFSTSMLCGTGGKPSLTAIATNVPDSAVVNKAVATAEGLANIRNEIARQVGSLSYPRSFALFTASEANPKGLAVGFSDLGEIRWAKNYRAVQHAIAPAMPTCAEYSNQQLQIGGLIDSLGQALQVGPVKVGARNYTFLNLAVSGISSTAESRALQLHAELPAETPFEQVQASYHAVADFIERKTGARAVSDLFNAEFHNNHLVSVQGIHKVGSHEGSFAQALLNKLPSGAFTIGLSLLDSAQGGIR